MPQFLSSESACGMRTMITELEDRWYSAPAGPSAAIICLEGIITHVPTLPDVRCTFEICKHWEVTSGIFVTSKTPKTQPLLKTFQLYRGHFTFTTYVIFDKTQRGFFFLTKRLCMLPVRYSLLHFISIWRSLYTSGSMITLFSHLHSTDTQWRRRRSSDSSPGFYQQIIWASEGWTDAWIPLICLNDNKSETASVERDMGNSTYGHTVSLLFICTIVYRLAYVYIYIYIYIYIYLFIYIWLANIVYVLILRKSKLQCLEQACWTFFAVRATSVKFGLHAGNIKFNT